MKKYSESDNYVLFKGNMLDMLEVIQPNSIDSIVTDPPYELNFMGKGWDNAGISFNKDTWLKCYEVLKPGGYLLAFGGSRTYHRIACAIEDAGFEIRDCIMWLYGSGFPKSMSLGKVIESKLINGSANVKDIKKLDGIKTEVHYGWNANEVEQSKRNKEYCQTKTEVNFKTDLGKKWNGWGTCLKPAYEPIIVARKPFKGSLVDNVIKNGVGGLNIDECRVKIINEDLSKVKPYGNMPINKTDCKGFERPWMKDKNKVIEKQINAINKMKESGRFPANVIHDGLQEEWSRYFYCAKASKKDRDEGLDEFETKQCIGGGGGIGNYLKDVNSCSGKFGSEKAPHKNTHPTVKPTELMQYLIRLVTPKNGIVLDPFMGSGSTGKAVMYENKERNANYKFIGIELTEEYLPIAETRINYAKQKNEKNKQLNIFEME